MNRRLIAIVASIAFGATMLIGCGGGQNASKQADNSNKGQNQKSVEKIKASDPSKIPDSSKNRKDTLIVGSDDFSGAFNPIYSATTSDGSICDLVFASLLGNNAKCDAVPGVADKWDISKDNKTYTFHLKKGVKFSNGQELTAKDVAFTYTAMCDPSYDGARSSAVDNLVGYKDYQAGSAQSVKGIKVIDDYTISFTLDKADVTAIWNFGYGIMPKSVYDFPKGQIQKLKQLFSKPVGAGPYKFVKFNPGQEVDLVKNDSYYKGAPKIKNIIVRVTNSQTSLQQLLAGDVDINGVGANPENIEQLKSSGFMNLDIYPSNMYTFLGFNLKHKIFQDKKVRQALTYGLDREGLVKSYFKGYATTINGPILPTSWAFDPNLNKYPYDSEKANKLLDEAGWKKGSDGIREKDGKKLSFQLTASTGGKFIDSLISIMKEDYKKIGIKVTPELMDFATLTSKVQKGDFDTFMMGWNLSVDPDPSDLFLSAQAKPGGLNYCSFINKESDQLLNEQKQEFNKEKRKEILFKWQKLMNEELPYIYLLQSKACIASNSRVKNLNVSTYNGWTNDVEKLELSSN